MCCFTLSIEPSRCVLFRIIVIFFLLLFRSSPKGASMKILVSSPLSPTSIYFMLSTLDRSMIVERSLALDWELSLSMHKDEFKEFLIPPVDPRRIPIASELPSTRLLSSASNIACDIFLTWDSSFNVLFDCLSVSILSGCLSTFTTLLPSFVLWVVVISYSLFLHPVYVVFSIFLLRPLSPTSILSNKVDRFLTILLV